MPKAFLVKNHRKHASAPRVDSNIVDVVADVVRTVIETASTCSVDSRHAESLASRLAGTDSESDSMDTSDYIDVCGDSDSEYTDSNNNQTTNQSANQSGSHSSVDVTSPEQSNHQSSNQSHTQTIRRSLDIEQTEPLALRSSPPSLVAPGIGNSRDHDGGEHRSTTSESSTPLSPKSESSGRLAIVDLSFFFLFLFS